MDKTPAWQKWIDHRLPFFSFIKKDLADYPTPKNLNYFWNFGSLAGITLMIMIITGLFLAMHYEPSATKAFQSVESIMRDVNYGWLLRYIHMNGASMFFLVIYVHMFRGLYYGSYKSPRELLWIIGVLIYLMMMATAFLGYVLPWGQMSYWGATVITSLFSAIPVVGDTIVTWLWGGFSVGNPTLNRFFVLHFLFPFLIVGTVVIHLIALHMHKSNNPTGLDLRKQDMVPFHPYYTYKDLFGLGVYVLFFGFFVFFLPNFFGEAINYVPANPLVTPAHIVPEWYFLPFYAILKSLPSKLGGVIMMFGAVFVLFIVPWLDTHPVRSGTYRPWYKWAFWVFVINCIVLGWVGANSPEGYFVFLGRFCTGVYFFFFLVVMPVFSKIERPLPMPQSLDDLPLKSHKPSQVKTQPPLMKGLFLAVALSSSFYLKTHGAETALSPPPVKWSFSGPFGAFNRAQLQRGFQVYQEVCASCHALQGLHYRDLAALGYSEKQIKAFAAASKVQDGPNDEGTMFDRPGRPSDAFFNPYPNEASARAANNGAEPVNLALIVKARPGGADYVKALLTGFVPPPAGVTLQPGMHYNLYFPGHMIAMAAPLSDGQVTYTDGVKATVDQMAQDVTAFLAWAAEPELEDRKKMGIKVMLYALFLSILMYIAMCRVWARLKR